MNTNNNLIKSFRIKLINIGDSIKELPILKICKHISGIHPSPELYEFPTPDGLIVALQEIYPDGEIILDCALFSQIYAYYTNDPMKTEYTFVLGLPINYTTLYNYEFYKLFYLLPSDQEAASNLQKFHFIGNGQWLVYDDDDKYIGLCSYGVVKNSLEWWINKCITTCVKYSETPAENIRQMSEKGIIDIYIKTGRLKKWYIESNNTIQGTVDELDLSYCNNINDVTSLRSLHSLYSLNLTFGGIAFGAIDCSNPHPEPLLLTRIKRMFDRKDSNNLKSNLHIDHNYKEDKVMKKYNFIKNEKNIPKKNINKVIKQPRS